MSTVAVVIHCHDQGRTLAAAVSSVLAQTRRPDEVIVVDGASSDPFTRNAMASLADPEVRAIVAGKADFATSLNVATRLTTADYLLFITAADTVTEDYLDRAASLLDGSAELSFVSSATKVAGRTLAPLSGMAQLLAADGSRMSALIRRTMWLELGGFDESLGQAAERDFWLRGFEGGVRGASIVEALVTAPGGHDSDAEASPDSFVATERQLLDRHAATLSEHAPALVLATQAAITQDEKWLAEVDARRTEAQGELAGLEAEIAALGKQLVEGGRETVDWGDLRRIAPFSLSWGTDRGLPIDRYYIHGFLAAHRADIRGRVLEVKDPGYTHRFGGERVELAEVLDVDASNPAATIIADLSAADNVPSNQFDCFILTQTLHVIADASAAVGHAARLLKPGGVLLCTLPCVSRINYEDGGIDRGDYWRFTEASIRSLFSEAFPAEAVEVSVFGNVLASTAFLYGLAVDELEQSELDATDPWFPLIFGVRATKPSPDGQLVRWPAQTSGDESAHEGAILMYHRVGDRQPDRNRLAVSADDFRADIAALAREYEPLTLDALADAQLTGRLLGNGVAVTIDDGYAADVEAITSVLEEFQVPATMYLTTAGLDGKVEYWWDALECTFGRQDLPDELTLTVGGTVTTHPTANDSDRAAAYEAVRTAILQESLSDRQLALSRIWEWAGGEQAPRGDYRPIMRAELRALAGHPLLSIGAHTISHPWLPAEEERVAVDEIVGSKSALEEVLGSTVRSFAYPYGAWSPSVHSAVRRAGFRSAVVIGERRLAPASNPWLLPRIEIGSRQGSARRLLVAELSAG